MESQYSFDQADVPPCPQLELKDFLGVVCSFQQLVEHYDCQAGPTDFTLTLGESTRQSFFTSSSTTNTGLCYTLSYNKAMFYFDPSKVWMVTPEFTTYNAFSTSSSKLSMYYFLWLYFQSIPTTKFFEAEKYVDKITAAELCKPTFNGENFVLDLIPSVSELAKRFCDLHKDEFTLEPLKPTFLQQVENLELQRGLDLSKESSSFDLSLAGASWSRDLSSICDPKGNGMNDVDTALIKDAMKKMSQIQRITFTHGYIYKLPLHPDIYPWSVQPNKCKCSTLQMQTIIKYMFMCVYKASKDATLKNAVSYFLDQFGVACDLYLRTVQSFNCMCRALCWNNEKGLLDELSILCMNYGHEHVEKIPQTWSNQQFRYGMSHYPNETKATLLKYFQHRIEPNLTDQELSKISKMDDWSVFQFLRKISSSRPKASLENYDKGSYRVLELEESGFWTKLQADLDSKGIVYLDFGGNTGEIAGMIGQKLGCDKSRTHCFDVAYWFDTVRAQSNENVTTYYTKLNVLPYDDDTFNFVSSFVTLHHLSELALSLSELVRVMKDGAIFLVREHDCDTPGLSAVIDIEHSLYEMVEKPTINYSYLDNYYATYWSRTKLVEILAGFGFVELTDWNIVPKKAKGFTKGPTRYYYSVYKLQKNQPPPPMFDDIPPPPPQIYLSPSKSPQRPTNTKSFSFSSVKVAQELERLRGIDAISKGFTQRFTRNEGISQSILTNYILCKAYDCLDDPEPVFKSKTSSMADSQLEVDWRRYRCHSSLIQQAKSYLSGMFKNIQTRVGQITKPSVVDCYKENNEFGLNLDTDFFLFGDDLNRMANASSDQMREYIAVQIIRLHYLHLSTVFTAVSPTISKKALTWFGGYYIHSTSQWSICWNDEIELGGQPNQLCSSIKTDIEHYIHPPNVYNIVIATLKKIKSFKPVSGLTCFVPSTISDGIILQNCPKATIKPIKQKWKNPFTGDSTEGVLTLKQIVL